MEMFKKFILVSSLLLASGAVVANSSYVIDNEYSSVNFSVTKKQYIVEPAIFQDVEGMIDNKGNVEIIIDMNSVDSSNPIRDNRLIDMFFQAEFFPATIVRANLDAEILNSKEPVQNITLEASVEIFEVEKDITLEVMVVKTGNTVVVTSLKPIIISGKRFEIPVDNLNALSKVCGGIAISDTVPVNFVLTFNKK